MTRFPPSKGAFPSIFPPRITPAQRHKWPRLTPTADQKNPHAAQPSGLPMPAISYGSPPLAELSSYVYVQSERADASRASLKANYHTG